MNNIKAASSLLCALAALLLASGCGFFAPDIGFGGAGSSGAGWGRGNGKPLATATQAESTGHPAREPLEAARAHVLTLARTIQEQVPLVVGLTDAATLRTQGIVHHDDVALLLDELSQAGLFYGLARELVTHDADGLRIRHVLLVLEDGSVDRIHASGGLYREADDGWVAVEVTVAGEVERVVATGLDGPHATAQVQELLGQLASRVGPCVVVCNAEAESTVSDALHAAGFVIAQERSRGLLFERDGE